MAGCKFPSMHGGSLDSLPCPPLSRETDNKAGVAGQRTTFSLCRVDEFGLQAVYAAATPSPTCGPAKTHHSARLSTGKPAATSSIPRMSACAALESRSPGDQLHAGSLGKNRRPVMAPVATSQSPGVSAGRHPVCDSKVYDPASACDRRLEGGGEAFALAADKKYPGACSDECLQHKQSSGGNAPGHEVPPVPNGNVSPTGHLIMQGRLPLSQSVWRPGPWRAPEYWAGKRVCTIVSLSW